jgi:hypothetical protein
VAKDQRGHPRSVYLQQAYVSLRKLIAATPVLADGLLRFYRPDEIGDPDDRVLAYTRMSANQAILAVHNLDHQWHHTLTFSDMGSPAGHPPTCLFDTMSYSIIPGDADQWSTCVGDLVIILCPLQRLVIGLLHD